MNLQNPLGGDPTTPPKTSSVIPPMAPAHVNERALEPAYKSVIRCLSDMDDLLDTVHDAASFAAVKPQLLNRARRQAEQASKYPNQGMTKLSRSASLELQKAADRHTEVLARAIQVAPAVREFFARDIAAIMNAK